MASITVTDLHLLEKEFEELSDPELKAVVGGREKKKVDLDGDGKWDVKIVVR
jgi:bacteriocin-like protein